MYLHNISRSALAIAVAAAALTTAACGSSAGTAAAGAGSAGPGTSAASASPSAASSSAAASGATTAAASPSASMGYPVDLQPAIVAPGGNVAVYGMSCSASTGTATSQAFAGPLALSMHSDATGGFTTVKPGLAAGQYTVTVTCGSITATGTLTVS